ncbi:MAG: CBS domain-containing protein [Bacteroidia bacterium]
MIARELISEKLSPLRLSDSVEAALEFLCNQGVSELPVLDKKGVYNYARLEQLSLEANKSKSLGEMLAYNPHTAAVLESQHLYEIVPTMASHALSVLAVVNRSGEFLGIIDQKDINRTISASLTYRGQGAVIVLRCSDRDFAPSHVARWVEENGAKMLGLMINQTEPGWYQVNIKLNTTLASAIQATLRRQGYEILGVYLAEDQRPEDDRAYDSVFKFFDL